MAEHKISGNDMLLFIGTDGTTYDTVICLTSNGITRSTNEIDAKTKCGPDKLPGTQDVAVNFEGQVMLDPATGTSLADLYSYWANKTTIYWKMGPVTPVTGDITWSGTGFVSKLDDTYQQDNPGTFSGSIGIYGSMSIDVE